MPVSSNRSHRDQIAQGCPCFAAAAPYLSAALERERSSGRHLEFFAQLLSDPQALSASAGAEQTAVLLPSCLSRNLPCTALSVRSKAAQARHQAEQRSQGEPRLPTAQPEASAHQCSSQRNGPSGGELAAAVGGGDGTLASRALRRRRTGAAIGGIDRCHPCTPAHAGLHGHGKQQRPADACHSAAGVRPGPAHVTR